MRTLEKVQMWILLTVLVGWFGYHFIYPFFLMDADEWHLLLTVVLMCAVCGCGFGAAFQQSAPWTITTFGVAFTIGHLSGGYFFPTTLSAVVILVFIISYLVGRRERKSTGNSN